MDDEIDNQDWSRDQQKAAALAWVSFLVAAVMSVVFSLPLTRYKYWKALKHSLRLRARRAMPCAFSFSGPERLSAGG